MVDTPCVAVDNVGIQPEQVRRTVSHLDHRRKLIVPISSAVRGVNYFCRSH